MADFSDRALFRQRPDLVQRSIAGEELLVPIRGQLADLERIFSMNPVGAQIWRALDGTRDVESLVDHVHASFDVDRARLYEDVCGFLSELLNAGLIEESR